MDIDDLLQELDDNQVPSGTRDIADLTQSWIAERSAPEILPFQTALLERLMERIRQQIELVETQTGNLDPKTNFCLILIQTELERVKFLVRSYLRARIHKIDKHSIYILTTPSIRGRLSPPELSYLKSHLGLLNSHFLASFLRGFPEHWGISMVEEPDLDGAVFCKVVKDIEDNIARIPGTDAEFKLTKGDVYVVRYSAVREFILRGEVELI
ncbi:hypothetical protein B9Z19DRAFT_1113511 [Tuber borchii]|uniref:DNA replication complex GINS protein SLD5 n=1 Tax=Tuber borchii TaxID=42251 RepID=A0A2T7A0R6_TUBBO|nr:hypothetical protein B9Z19DRAFT_1113511 [Tuber borchii]